MYTLTDIKKNYQQGETQIQVLKGLNFSIKEGETVSVVGQSGSGKSTLLSILCGLENVNEGNLSFDGADLTNQSEDELTLFRSQELGIIFQHFHLVPHLTALENVLLPLEIQGIDDEKKGLELLKRVGLDHRGHHFPAQLSGGEMQRVAVARALITSPKVILADEPSGNLDKENAAKIIDLMFELVKERSTSLVLVTHDMELAKKCERQLKLENGILV